MLKQMLLSTSACASKCASKSVNPKKSYLNTHKECNHATLEKMYLYKHTLMLHKLHHSKEPEMVRIALNFQKISTTWQVKFQIIKTNNYKFGNNILANRIALHNNQVLLEDLDCSSLLFKLKYITSLLQWLDIILQWSYLVWSI